MKDAQELFPAGRPAATTAEKAAAYSRHLYDIAAATNAEVTRSPRKPSADAQKRFWPVDTAVKNAPAGTETPSRW